MGIEPIDWEDLAFDHGFPTDHALLATLYLDRRLTQEQIGQVLGISGTTVGKRLRVCGIEVRKNGGVLGCRQGPRLPGNNSRKRMR